MARMRLRSRSPRTLGEGWLRPRGSGRWTTIGNLDSPARGLVDPAGLLTVEGATWSLDWWIGAEDRWHLPSQEVAVRQSLLSGSPVVETRLRVPGGDAVHRTYAARSIDGSEAIVVEIENASTIPFAVALAVRPHGQVTVGRIDSIEVQGSRLLIDGSAVVVLPTAPGRVALADASRDSAEAVFAGDAAQEGAASVSCRDGLAQGAVLFPLAHTARLRIALPLSGSAPAAPAAFPAPQEVASGWGAHAAGGTRIEVPDRRLRDAVVASTRHLLLGQDGLEVVAALDLLGLDREAARLLNADPVAVAQTDAPGAALRAIARHWELTREPDDLRSLPRLIGALIGRLGRTDPHDASTGRVALASIATLLDALGEHHAADDVRRLVAGASGSGSASDSRSEDVRRPDLGALLAGASSTWTWSGAGTGHDLTGNAALVTAVRDLLVREVDEGLALCPVVDDTWLGQGWEIHDAPTRHGRLSYAVRWHGDRPALLWELSPHAGDPPCRLRIPGLDAGWSSTEPIGEALLAPVALPDKGPRRGLTIPVAIEPSPRRPT